MENLRNRTDVKLVTNEKDYLKWASKSSYLSQKVFDNDLVAIRKSKVTLTLNKPAYIGVCILDLMQVLMYESSIMITLQENIVTIQDYVSLTRIL